jgi:hypothetical protein
MTSRLSITLLFLLIYWLPGAVRADVSEFSSFDECILESLKGVSSDVAANAIIASCRNKFPESVAPAAAPAEPTPEVAESAPEAASVPEPGQEAVQPEAVAAAAVATAAAGESRELTKEEMENLKATLFGFTTKYQVTFENFNENITVTEVTIAVWDDLDPRGLKKYTQTMHIPPQETQKVTYQVVYMGDDQGWRWKVDSAKGVE